MKTIAQQIKLLALALTITLTTSGCSFDFLRSPSADYTKPGELSQDVDSLPDPSEFKKTSADHITINSIDSMRRVESPERLLTQANDYFEQKRYHDSARLYKKYLATPAASTASPDILATAHYRVGFVANKKMQYLEASQEYRQALQIAPFNNDYLFAYARSCYEAGDYATAEAQFAQLTTRAPGYPEGQYYYGLALLESADRARALQPLTAAKGDLEAYFLLADKHYAKGELQQAVQTEARMGQIAASLGLKAPELPHKSKASGQFLASSPVAPTSPSVPSQNVDVRSTQETATSTLANVPSQINGVQPSTSASVATPNASSVAVAPQTPSSVSSPETPTASPTPTPNAVVPSTNPQLATNANPIPAQVERQDAPSQVALPVQPTSESVASAPQLAPTSTPLQGTPLANPHNIVPNNVQIAQIPTVPNPTANALQNAAQYQTPNAVQFAQVQTAPNPTASVLQNAAQYQAPNVAQFAQVQTVSNPTANALQNAAQYQAPNDAQFAQVQTVPNPTANALQNAASYNEFRSNETIAASTSNSLPVPAVAGTSNFANSEPFGTPSPNVGIPAFVQNAPLSSVPSETYVKSSENTPDDDDWDDDDFAFACSGRPSEPVPTADLIGTEEPTATRSPEESFVENENQSEIRRPETSEIADALTVPSEASSFNEVFSRADLLLNEKLENVSAQDEGTELAQTPVATPETPQALETAQTEPSVLMESEPVADNLVASDVEVGNAVESNPSQISDVVEPSFIDFRPGSTMNASLVTLPRNAPEEEEERETSVDVEAEIPNETFVADYNVPQFPSEPVVEQNVEELEATTPIQRVYTIKDLERLASDWTLFEQNLISYLTPNFVAEETYAQAQNIAPQTPTQTVSSSIPQQGYNSPEEFFKSTRSTNAPVAQQTQPIDAPVAQQATTVDGLTNRTALSEYPSEISQLKSNTRRNTTPEERLQAARAAGAEVVELTPEQYRQAVMLGTSRR